MRFARPELFWLLLPVALMATGLGLMLSRRRQALQRFVGARFMDRLVEAASIDVRILKIVLLSLGLVFLVVAMARPQWGATAQQISRRGVDVLIGIDISESMLAEDIKPNRLGKSIQEASGLLDRLDGDRVGLLAFAGAGGVLCPLTLDYGAVRMFLDTLTPDMISFPGTSLSDGLRAGIEAFSTEERKFKVMVIFSDGEDQTNSAAVKKAAQDAADQGIIINVIGVGTPDGAPIPERSETGDITGYKKDGRGRVVTTRMDESLLAMTSTATGGKYFRASAVEAELDRIAEAIAGMDKKEMQSRVATQFEERFQFPLGLGLLLLFVESFLSNRRRRTRQAAQGATPHTSSGTERGKQVRVA